MGREYILAGVSLGIIVVHLSSRHLERIFVRDKEGDIKERTH